ncbi:MAG: methyltransferase [Thermoplasmata archaeon]
MVSKKHPRVTRTANFFANMFKYFAGVPKARHLEISAIISIDDDPYKPTDELIELSIDAVKCAHKCDLTDIIQRLNGKKNYINVFPGEHYKLLAGFVQVLNPKCVIEVGTERGISALCLKKYMQKDAKLVTFDIIPWDKMPDCCLDKSDFNAEFVQYTDDLSTPEGVNKHKELINNADLFFIDAAKDSEFEYKLMEQFYKVGIKDNAILIFDDIRVWNMLEFWREIRMPKLDLTSFGHFSGTGVVQWKNIKI